MQLIVIARRLIDATAPVLCLPAFKLGNAVRPLSSTRFLRQAEGRGHTHFGHNVSRYVSSLVPRVFGEPGQDFPRFNSLI